MYLNCVLVRHALDIAETKGENEMLNPTAKQIEQREKTLSNDLGMEIDRLTYYADGFSFTVETELEAYKAAYKYQHRQNVHVVKPDYSNDWLVHIYT